MQGSTDAPLDPAAEPSHRAETSEPRPGYESVGNLDFEQSEPADGVGWPLTMVSGAAMAVFYCWQAVLYHWRWSDPGIGDVNGHVIDVLAGLGLIVAFALGAFAVVLASRNSTLLRLVACSAVILTSGAAAMFFAASLFAGTVAFQVYGDELRAESARLERQDDQRPVELRGVQYLPSPAVGENHFPACFTYTGDGRFLVWCPNGTVPSFGGTGDRSRGIGDGWFLMF